MAFDWMHVPPHPSGDAHHRQTEQAVRDRAAMLRRLGYDQPYVTARAHADLAWEYECTGTSPLDAKEVDALIARVFG